MAKLTQSTIKQAANALVARIAEVQMYSPLPDYAGQEEFAERRAQMIALAKASADLLDAMADNLAYHSNWQPELSAQESMLEAVEGFEFPSEHSLIFDR